MTEFVPSENLPTVTPLASSPPPPPQPLINGPQYAEQPTVAAEPEFHQVGLPQVQAAGTVVTASAGTNVAAVIAWIITVLTLGYMLPWAIAATRRKSNSGAIGVLNLLLGWSIIGWVVALVMACGTDRTASPAYLTNTVFIAQNFPAPPATTPAPLPAAGWYPDASGVQKYWDGTRWVS